jgi:hypothetical protein
MKAWQGLTAIVVIVGLMVLGVLVQRRTARLLVLNQLADASFDEARRHHARTVDLHREATKRGCVNEAPMPTPMSGRPALARGGLEAEVRLDRARAQATGQFELWTALMATAGPCVEGWERRIPVREVEPWLPWLPSHRRPAAPESEALSFAARVHTAELLQGFVRSVEHLRATACEKPDALVEQFRAELAARDLPPLYWAVLYEPSRVGEEPGTEPFLGPFGAAPARVAAMELERTTEDADPRLDGVALAPRVANWIDLVHTRWLAKGRPVGEAILLTLLSWRVGEAQIADWLSDSAKRLQVDSAAITFVELEDTALGMDDESSRARHGEAFPYVPRVVAAAIVADELCPQDPPAAGAR